MKRFSLGIFLYWFNLNILMQVNIDPVFLDLGFLHIRYYGLVYVLAFFLVYYLLHKKREELKLNKNEIDSIIIWLFAGMIIGSRIVALLSQEYGLIFRDPLAFFKIWEGGMSFFGGLIGALLAGIYAFKRYNINFYRVANLIVVPVSFILILGRLANFVNQELVGKVTNVSWCFNFANYVGCRHPYQLYSAFLHLILFIIVFFIYKFNKKNTFWAFIFGYGILRFITEFFRDETLVWGITLWQYLSLAMIGIAFYYLIKKK